MRKKLSIIGTVGVSLLLAAGVALAQGTPSDGAMMSPSPTQAMDGSTDMSGQSNSGSTTVEGVGGSGTMPSGAPRTGMGGSQ